MVEPLQTVVAPVAEVPKAEAPKTETAGAPQQAAPAAPVAK